MSQLSPAREIVEKLGGVRATARILSMSPSAVSRWMMSRDKRGTNGHIPRRHWPAILKHSRAERLAIRLSDLADI
jgi:DNA-binding transcriptional regulator YdaS (Cro superfamily)